MIRTLVRRTAFGLAGTATVGAAAATGYACCTEQGAGFRREVQFWSKVFPVVFDYYIQTASSSPYVKYRNYVSANYSHESDETRKRRRKEKLNDLHEKHADDILQVMLDLKGLYVKLGQVLSVTALPVPEAFRIRFRTLQSNVPGWEDYETVVKPTLEKEFGCSSRSSSNNNSNGSGSGRKLEDIFESIDPIPCGAASIGQAHRATLKKHNKSDGGGSSGEEGGRDVIVKVQYPDAAWQVPADIQCVGDFLKVCVFFDVVDEQSAKMSYDEFARQFLSELDYDRERSNLRAVFESSLDPSAPYARRNVVIPEVHEELCTSKVITMTYLKGPKLEEEAKRQLELLGIDTSGGIARIVRDAAKEATDDPDKVESGELVRRVTKQLDSSRRHNSPYSWKLAASKVVGQVFGFDAILKAVRLARQLLLWSQAAAVATIQAAPRALVPTDWEAWADVHRTASAQAERLSLTEAWMDALFDVHGHQVFSLGLFNADPHPGNILVIEEDDDKPSTKLGLIDYGQCKQLNPVEQYKVAKLLLSVANNEPDVVIASAFRNLDIVTKNDSTEFLAKFARLMFGPFKPEHLDHSWHMRLHKMDKVMYFPKELSMVYRTSLLLRGLAVSLQLNYSIGEQWKHHAQGAVERMEDSILSQPDRVAVITP